MATIDGYLNQFAMDMDKDAYKDAYEYQKQKQLEAYAKQITAQRNVAGLLGGNPVDAPRQKPEEPNLVLLLEDV